ncbi:MAG TPA: ABC transporter substrate-binding protein [Candidatus Methylomirabilis sp.]|nr:ABC transporter substrate-binding protein [Candidatus Methylomirabilis sp.]
MLQPSLPVRVDPSSFQSDCVALFTRVILVLAWLLAAGCADRSDSGVVTLVFKHAKILGPSDPVPGLLKEFETLHPGVRVRSEALTWNSDEQHQFYVVNLEGGNAGVDVLMLDVIWVPEFAQAGWLLDLTPFLEPSELAPYFPAAVEPAVRNGRVWALPWFMNVGLLYYRKDLLDKYGLAPPRTYAELVDQVGRIKSAERDAALDGFLWQGKQYEGMVVNVLEGFWANGTQLFGDSGTVFPDPDRAAEVLAFLRSLIVSGVSPPWVTAADEELTRRAFQDGHAIFLRNWPYVMDLVEQPGSPVRGKVAIASLPRHAHGTRGIGSTGGAHLGVNARTRYPKAAAELVRFLAGHAAELAMARGAALSPSRMALYHAPDLVRDHPDFPKIYALTMVARPRPIVPYYLMASTMLQPEFSAVLVGIKTARQAVTDGRFGLTHLLDGLR